MRSEELDSLVEVQKLQTGKDGTGQPRTSWVTIYECWASILDLSGRQYIAAAATKNAITESIKIRFDELIHADYRIKAGNDVYDIEVILKSKDRRWMTLMCKTGVSNG